MHNQFFHIYFITIFCNVTNKKENDNFFGIHLLSNNLFAKIDITYYGMESLILMYYKVKYFMIIG